MSKLFIAGAALWQDAALKATHVEEQVGVVFAVDRNKAVLPLDCGNRSGQTVLDVPEHSTTTGKNTIRKVMAACLQIWYTNLNVQILRWNSQVDVMLHQSHACITGPALLVVITHNVLIVGVWVLSQVPLNQISGLISREPGREKKKKDNLNLSAKTAKSAIWQSGKGG